MQFILVTLDFFEENDNNEDGVGSTPKVQYLICFLFEAQIYFLLKSLLFSVCQRTYSYL